MKVTKGHDAEKILSYLKKETVGILGTLEKETGSIRLRVMYYGIDNEFNCYLMSTKESPKINQLLTTSNVSLIIYKLEDPYDNSWEIEIDGKAKLLEEQEEIDYALSKLKERNPFSDVAIESGITGQFDLIRLIPRVVRFRLYGEALKGILPTVLEF